jgi:hypothetical protein
MQNNPKALKKAQDILEPLREFFMEEAHPFIAAAEWPDDIKGQKWTNFNIIHFLNFPIIDPSFTGDVSTSVDNATMAYNECMNTLKKGKGDIATIGKSVCMRFLIHIVGDVHQPLHTATLFSSKFPTGDMGGNLFEIDYPATKSLNELHAYWDSTGHHYSASIKVPLSDHYYEELQEISQNITEVYTRNALKSELSKKTFEEWVDESGNKAFEFAYDSLKLKPGDTITDEYEAKARELIDRQLALGGYRLADSLTQALKAPGIEELLKE